jgi:hypothetical protein
MTVNNNKVFGVAFTQPPVVSPGIDQGYFNVPASGFATDEGLYGVFWTNHCAFPAANHTCDNSHGRDPATDFWGRSVLTRSNDNGKSFQQVANIPKPFVYTATVNTDRISGLPANQKMGVLVFGVPCYRESTPYLATATAAQVDDPYKWQYLQGLTDSGPTWGWNPLTAAPVFDSASDRLKSPNGCAWYGGKKQYDGGCVGEFSVDWNNGLQKWVMLYGCGDPQGSDLEQGVRLRVADAPWGPWSDPTTIFNPDNDFGDHGTCHYMHRGGSPACDDVGGDNGDDWGAPYAPFLLSRYSQIGFSGPDGVGARLFYALSTWNPYQVVIMQTNVLLPAKR